MQSLKGYQLSLKINSKTHRDSIQRERDYDQCDVSLEFVKRQAKAEGKLLTYGLQAIVKRSPNELK